MRKLILLTLAVFCTAGLFAQQSNATLAAAEFCKVNEAYASSQKLSMKLQYDLFPSYTSTAVFEKQQGVYMKQGDNSYSCLLGIVSLSNASISLTLDSSEKAIVVTDPPRRKKGGPEPVDIDSLLRICSSIEIRDAGTDLKLYKLKFDKLAFFEYSAIDIYINPKTHFLDRFILYYRAEMDLDETDSDVKKERPRLEIRYTDITLAPVFAADQFSEKRFVRTSGKNITCATAYSGYRLINNKLK